MIESGTASRALNFFRIDHDSVVAKNRPDLRMGLESHRESICGLGGRHSFDVGVDVVLARYRLRFLILSRLSPLPDLGSECHLMYLQLPFGEHLDGRHISKRTSQPGAATSARMVYQMADFVDEAKKCRTGDLPT